MEVDPFPILEWHWTEAKEKLTAAGEEGWNLIRQLIIIIHQLLAAFLADLYYLGFDPNYQPQFLYLKSELDLFGAAFNPYINLLQELQEQQLETYEEELVQLLPPSLPEFSFETVTISQRGLNRRKGQAQYFTVDLGKVVTLDMVAIPGGEFLMGSSEDEEKRFPNEGPQHWVKVPPFFMSKYPVTQAQWEAVMGNNPSRWREPNLPVERVSWSDSVKFCYQLTQKTKKQFRLATEAEWEYAARAGTTTPFHFGGTITTNFANYNGNYTYGFGYKGVYRQKTTVVGSFPPNSFGLYDMHGNVWEWCYDIWHDNYINAPKNGWSWEEGREGSGNRCRVLRGGSWDNDPGACRSAIRSHQIMHTKDKFIGLRIVCQKTK